MSHKNTNEEVESEEDDEVETTVKTSSKKQKITYASGPRHAEIEAEQPIETEEDELKRQLRLEKEEAEGKTQKKTRIDPDGTEYEYDPVMKGWFPKIPDEKYIQYQMNYAAAAAAAAAGSGSYQASYANYAGYAQLVANQVYLYNGKFYKWDTTNNNWIDAGQSVYSYVDYLTGLSYSWNQEKNEWQQVNNTQQETNNNDKQQQQQQQQQSSDTNNKNQKKTNNDNNKEEQKKEGWFDINDSRNTNVYVTGLPLDITEDEFEAMMNKYGVIAKDLEKKKLKLKLYQDENGGLKGDGICTYLMPESVKLCLELLDGSEYKGHKINAERAKFQPKAEFDNKNVKKKSKVVKQKEKKFLEKQRQKLLGWDEEPEVPRAKHEKVVVISNLFDPKELANNEFAVKRLNDNLKSDLEQYGTVKKIIIHERNPSGVATCSFQDVEDADDCCEYLNNRIWHNGRIITCETWDGKTKYDLEDSEEERKKRDEEWQKFLESDE